MDKRQKDKRCRQILAIFARNVRLLRNRKGWSQRELAERIGVHRHTILRVEAGRHETSFPEACLMADALGASIADMRAELVEV